ncbi:hypothetical protein Ptr902_02335 [Pyrenophora tritici-repentis]|nr:hypothetical protein Ptr902_13767 [Pyrenophora tritici-repentis]KAI2488202.1 hypothetical protein Ptr902_02335 [Pyrenophora tritici-repentis]
MNRLGNTHNFLATYRQYNEDTDYIANWLAETARSIGYEPVEEKSDQPRQRVRNRNKKAKGKKSARSGGGGGSGEKKYSIKIVHFVPIAEAIADNEEKILVPFKKKAVEDEHDSNERHYYFITVLENAFRLLKPFISSGPEAYRPPSGSPAYDASGATSENRFANSTVEDIADIAEKEGAEEAKLPDFGNKLALVQDESELEEELQFAVTLFIQELQNVTDIACAQWAKYKDEKVDLIVPAMTTDLAIKLVQRAETEFDLVVKRPKKYPTNIFPLWRLLDVLIKPSIGEKPLEGDGSIFWPTYLGLKQYMDLMVDWTPNKNLPAIVPKDFGNRKIHDATLRAIEFAQIIRIMMFGKHPDVWDMCSQGVEIAFNNRKLYVWVVVAVQLHIASQDTMGDRCAHPSFELESHFQKVFRQQMLMTRDWRNPLLPEDIYFDCIEAWSDTLGNIQEWSSQDGFDQQWSTLALKQQINAHPVLKMLRQKANKNYYMRHHPLLYGIMKYEMYLKKQAAGLKMEYQSLSISKLAHVYINGHLQFGDDQPVWPDMEFVIYAQDPEWLFVGGRPKTVEEAQKKFLIISGSKAANSARDIQINKLKIDQKNLREFRDPMVFGTGVFLPRKKFSKAKISVVTTKVEEIINCLIETINSPQPWGRLARHIMQIKHGNTTASHQATPRTTLETYAQWLEADLIDLYFDWLGMGHRCGDIWRSIRTALERLDTWDPASFQDKPAMEATIDILTRDRQYPKFLGIAYGLLLKTFEGYPAKQPDSRHEPDAAIVAIAKYKPQIAAVLEAPGELSLDNLYAHWREQDWKPRWEKMKTAPANELKDMFIESFFSSFMSKEKKKPKFSAPVSKERSAMDMMQSMLAHLAAGTRDLPQDDLDPELKEVMKRN